MKTFPIMSDWDAEKHQRVECSSIPLEMIAPHEKQALLNHCGQNLQHLAKRGGLSFCEAVAVLEDRPWRKMALPEARRKLAELVKEFQG